MFDVRRALLFLVVLLVSCSPRLHAQAPQPRIREAISNATRLTLPGSRSPLILAGKDLGPVPSDQQLGSVALVFQRSAAQQTELDTLLASQGNRSSSLYHHWLTPQAFAARFGMAAADLEATRSWLSAQGFTVTSIPASHDRILFSGTAAQIASTFGTSLHRFESHGESHFGPATDLSLPAALAPVTAAVLHLTDLRPRPNSHPLPAYTDATTGKHFLTPADLALLYNLHASATDGLTGRGQSIAIVGQSYTDPTMIGLTSFNQPLGYTVFPSLVLVPGSGVEALEPGALAEAQLDLEYAGGTAPLANLLYVFVGDDPTMNVFDALNYAIEQDIAPVVSISYGLCESLLSNADANSANALFQQAAAQGQTLVAASGDSGSTSCARFTSAGLTTTQLGALSVGFPASSPYVTAVGGTQMTPAALTSGANPFWAGTSTPQNTSVLSYVPEIAWNEGSPTHGILAGGGGASTLFSRPSWQSTFSAMPAGSTRLVPDIALQASVASPGFLLCTNDIAYVGSKAESSCANTTLNSLGFYTVAGGTSFPTPVFAGSVALLNQQLQEQGQGVVNPTLYGIAANAAAASSVFHDITAGSNACITGAFGCTSAGQAGFSAASGFDEATGLGSVNFASLRAAWPGNPSFDPARQSLNLSCTEILNTVDPGTPFGDQCSLVPWDASGTYGSGTVSAFLDGVPLSTVQVSSTGFFYFNPSFTAPSTQGSHLLQVVYSGDTTHLPAASTTPFMVGPVLATGTFSLSAPALSLGANASAANPITITPTPGGNGYHGFLYWYLSATQVSGTGTTTLCYRLSPIRVAGVTTASLSLGAGTSCTTPQASAAGMRPLSGTTSAHHDAPPRKGETLPLCAGLLGLGLLGIRRARRRVPSVLLVACFALVPATLLVTGCGGSGNSSGGGGSPPPVAPTVQPAVFTITLTGHDSVNTNFVTANTSFTLTVN